MLTKIGNRDNKHNAHGYSDPTAYAAMKTIDDEEKRISKLVKTLSSVCELAGFEIEGRVTLVDKRTGKIWR